MIKHSHQSSGMKFPKWERKTTFKIIVLISVVITAFIIVAWYNSNDNKKWEDLERKLKQQQTEIDSLRKRDSLFYSISFRKNIEKKAGVDIPDKTPHNHLKVMVSEAKKYKLPIRLVTRLIHAESRFNPNAVSSCGAIGYAQIMPVTYRGYARKFNLSEVNTPINNIKVGIGYYYELTKVWLRRGYNTRDSRMLAAASYNTGVGKVGVNPRYFLSRDAYTYKYTNFIVS